MSLIKEIIIENYPEENTPLIRIFNNGTSYLIADDFEEIFPDEDVDEVLSDLFDLDIEWEDREVVLIPTDDETILYQIKDYLESLQQ